MKTRLTVAAFFLVIGLLVQACTNDAEDTIATTGTVIFLSFEGGFYGIEGDNGQHYDPINLPIEFQKVGLRIRFEAKEYSYGSTSRQWGKYIEIRHIEKL